MCPFLFQTICSLNLDNLFKGIKIREELRVPDRNSDCLIKMNFPKILLEEVMGQEISPVESQDSKTRVHSCLLIGLSHSIRCYVSDIYIYISALSDAYQGHDLNDYFSTEVCFLALL